MNPELDAILEGTLAAGGIAKAAAEGVQELSARLRDVEQLVAASVAQGPAPVPRDELAAAIVANPAFEKFRSDLVNGEQPQPARFNVRTMSNDISRTTAPIVVPHAVPGIVGLPFKRKRVVDLLPKHKATRNSVVFLRQSADSNAAAPVSELAPKPQTAMVYEEVEAPIITLAHWARASKQILADVPGLQNFIGTRLLDGLAEVRERQIMGGSGTGENLHGLLHQASEADMQNVLGDSSATWRGTAIERPGYADIIRCAIADVEIATGMMVDAIILNPVDIASIEASKRPDGRYVIAEDTATGTRMLTHMWQRPVVSSINVEPGQFFVGCFEFGVALYVREEAAVEIGYAGTDFTENAVRILAEERLAMPVWQSGCFVKGEF